MKSHSEIGREAQYAGQSFEDWINTQHDKARYLGILAHVEKTQAVAKIVHGRLIYTENGVADYIGCLENGMYLALEAKSTKSNRFARSNITMKQQDHLERVARAGGLALLLVEFREERFPPQRFAIPWLCVPWKVMRTAESIGVFGLENYLVDPECYLKRWHVGGRPSTVVQTRRYARE